ncbi:MAG: hypothetical protein GY755_09765 [Chloroflexi bacterium]|nr:hypothetical protein [Chloroflexota bacterium]
MSDNNINAGRRRKGSKPPSGRAEAPKRRKPSGSGSRPQSTGGGGLPIPRSGKAKGGCGSFLVILLMIGYFLLSGGEGIDLGEMAQSPGQNQNYQEPVQPAPETNFTPPAATGNEEQTWLVMLYQDADDKILEEDIFIDLNEAEKVGSSQNVHIVAQLDRFRGGFSGDGNWDSTRRYYVQKDNDLNRINSQLVADLGEVSMSRGESLIDFVTWSMVTFPADKYVLILSDHGMGWPGGWTDPAPGGQDGSSIPLAARLDDHLYMMEMDQAFGEIRNRTGVDKLDIIGMDACLMAQLEVFAALQPHAHYGIASEETEPALGWAYAGFLDALVKNPGMSAEDLSKLVVQSYIDEDQRIVDQAARDAFLRGGSPMGGLFSPASVSAEQLAAQLEKNVTLTAVDLNKLPALMNSFNDFSYALQDERQGMIAEARNYAQSYTSIFGREVPPSYIDLGHFVQLVGKNSSTARTAQAATEVISALSDTVVAEKHGRGKPGSTGIAIYYPNSALYRSAMTGMQSYTGIADRFANASLWDEFLIYHYSEFEFTQDVQQPLTPSTEITRAPGLGQISISTLRVSNNVAAPDQPITLSADIYGENIGHIYLFVGYLDEAANSIFVADMDYLESPDTREVGGVYYPQWGKDGDFTLNFTWDPIIFAVSDGSISAEALFVPENYGQSAADASYSVEGLYTFAETGESRKAKLYFQDEALQSVFVFTGQEGIGAPREVIPQSGDTFTVQERWLDIGVNGAVETESAQAGKTLRFGDGVFTWEQLYAAQGDYILGFLIEDMDGNQYPAYTKITVE